MHIREPGDKVDNSAAIANIYLIKEHGKHTGCERYAPPDRRTIEASSLTYSVHLSHVRNKRRHSVEYIDGPSTSPYTVNLQYQDIKILKLHVVVSPATTR